MAFATPARPPAAAASASLRMPMLAAEPSGASLLLLRHLLVVDQGAFHLDGGDAVPRDVHDVVHPAHEPEIAILVHLGPVAGEVHLLPRSVGLHILLRALPVRLDVPVWVAVDPAEHGRP